MKRILLSVVVLLLVSFNLTYAAYLTNVPRIVKQPDGTELHCFASGDEFYNRLHDANGYTIVQDPQTGYYVYADKINGRIVPTQWVAGNCNPAQKGLRPNLMISQKEYQARRDRMLNPARLPMHRDENTNKGNYNNIVVFIRFSDDVMFENDFAAVDQMFNDSSDNYRANSLFDYFKRTSYDQLFIHTTFYPQPDGNQIISYQDTFPRVYFMPQSAANPEGYIDNDSVDERTPREHALLARAIAYVEDMIPTDLDLDYNNDGYIDNVCFVIKGDVGDWNDLLWPHRWALYAEDVYLHGKRVWDFNLQLADASYYFSTSVMCHEMFHSLGAPDLYHYDDTTNMDAVGAWDLMCSNRNPPQQTCAYMKYKYGNWLDASDIIPLTEYGTYTIKPLNSTTPDKICYRILTSNPLEFILMDYRNQLEPFDEEVPGRGIIFYRINALYDGNASYNGEDILDEIYVYRKNGTPTANGLIDQAFFRGNVAARKEFSPTTNPYPFLSNGDVVPIHIGNLTSGMDSIQFDYMEWVGIEDLSLDGYAAYPNPVQNQLNITLPNASERTIQIYNNLGMLMDSFTQTETAFSWNVSSYAAGLYLVKIIDNQNKIKTIKFIKQ